MISEQNEKLQLAADSVGRDWKQTPYYDKAELHMDTLWEEMIWPFLSPHAAHLDFSTTMDLAAGHGRNSAKLISLASRLYIVDINQENIDFCRNRFGRDNPKVVYHLTDGYSLPFLPDGELTFVYCFDAMVHFDSDVVRAYLGEFRRVLQPGVGRAFLHHSNYVGNPGGDHRAHPSWRNFMSKELFAHYAKKEGLDVVSQQLIDWMGDGSNIDCLSLLSRPE